MVALDHAEGAFSAGQVMGLVGKNGAGKSTLIKVLAGATQPDEGEVLVDGEPTQIHDPHHATELGLAFVHQELADVPKLTVAENVELGLGYPKHLGVWLDRRGLRAKVREVLDRLGAEGIDPKAQVGSLSVADQRMVMIARGMAVNARLLVLDEPSASLSERGDRAAAPGRARPRRDRRRRRLRDPPPGRDLPDHRPGDRHARRQGRAGLADRRPQQGEPDRPHHGRPRSPPRSASAR